jgi:hypothetical protein
LESNNFLCESWWIAVSLEKHGSLGIGGFEGIKARLYIYIS